MQTASSIFKYIIILDLTSTKSSTKYNLFSINTQSRPVFKTMRQTLANNTGKKKKKKSPN